MALFRPQNRAGFCAAYASLANTEGPQRDLSRPLHRALFGAAPAAANV
jgi:hypothetical protein